MVDIGFDGLETSAGETLTWIYEEKASNGVWYPKLIWDGVDGFPRATTHWDSLDHHRDRRIVFERRKVEVHRIVMSPPED